MNRHTTQRSLRRTLAAAVVGLAGAATIAQAESTWTGAGSPTGIQLWDSPVNWSSSAVPASGADVRFGGGFGSGSVINAAGTRTVGKLTISTFNQFFLRNFGGEGNSIILNSGDLTRTSMSQGTQVISSNIVLNSDGQWDINGTGVLHMAGGINSASNIAFEKFGAGTVVLSDTTSSIGGRLWVTGGNLVVDTGADVTAAGTSSFGGLLVGAGGSQLTVQGGGTLRAFSVPSMSQGGAAVVTGNGSSFQHTGSAFSVGDINNGTLTVQNGGSFNTSGTMLLGVGSPGGNSNGTLLVQFGGKAKMNYLAASSVTGSRGQVIVDGAGASLQVVIGADLGNVAGNPVGSMSISNGGAANIGGQLRLFGTNASVNVNAGSLVAGSLVSIGAGPVINLAADPTNGAALVIDGDDGSTTGFAAPITGSGSVIKTGNSTQALLQPNWTGKTIIDGGTLSFTNGMSSTGGPILIHGNGQLSAAGTVNRRLSDGTFTSDGEIFAAGTLNIGDSTSTDGFKFNGRLVVGTSHVALQDANRAELGYEVTLDAGGKLSSTNGITANGSITANSTATIAGALTANLGISMPIGGHRLIFTGDVDGPANMRGNAEFQGKYSPGTGVPADVDIDGRVEFTQSGTFAVQLGGAAPGTQYDRLTTNGATIDGTLDVSTYNNFIPLQGQSFTVLRAEVGSGSIAGSFDQTVGRRVNATTWLCTLYSPNEVRLAVALPGDATLDGKVAIDDFARLASAFNLTGKDWTQGDFNGDGTVAIGDFGLLAARFNQMLAAELPRGAAVPEPAGLLVVLPVAALLRRR